MMLKEEIIRNYIRRILNEAKGDAKSNKSDISDISYPKDKELLFKLLEEIQILITEAGKDDYTLLSSEAKEEAEYLAGKLGLDTSSLFKAGNRNRIGVITDIPRQEFFVRLKELGYERDLSIPGSGSGGMKKGTIEVIHKPSSAQVGGGHGKENEETFRGRLNELIKQAGGTADIKITDGGSEVLVEDITSVVDNSKTKTGEYYKPDADLMSGETTTLGVSIKKDGGARWESSKSRLEDIYNNFIEKAKAGQIPNLKLVQRDDAKEGKFFMQTKDGRNYGKIVIDKFPDTFDSEFIFGKQEKFPVIVVERSFSPDDFKINNKINDKIITVQVSKIYETLDDVKEAGKTPVVVFSHHINKQNGIEIRVFPASGVPKDDGRAVTMKINYKELNVGEEDEHILLETHLGEY